MAEIKRTELASRIGELTKQMYDLINEANKNGEKAGLVLSFVNEVGDVTEHTRTVVGKHSSCAIALAEIINGDKSLAKDAAMRAFVMKFMDVKPEEVEDHSEDDDNKFDKAAEQISDIIKGLKED